MVKGIYTSPQGKYVSFHLPNVKPVVLRLDVLYIVLSLAVGVKENVCSFYNYMMKLRQWTGTSFYEELAAECGYTINTTEDILLSKKDVITHFEKEFDFVLSRAKSLKNPAWISFE